MEFIHYHVSYALCRIGPIWGLWRNHWEAETPCIWHYLFCILFWLPVSFNISHFPYISIEHNLPSTYFFLYLFGYTFFHSFPFYENNSKIFFSIVLFFHHNHHPFRLLQKIPDCAILQTLETCSQEGSILRHLPLLESIPCHPIQEGTILMNWSSHNSSTSENGCIGRLHWEGNYL